MKGMEVRCNDAAMELSDLITGYAARYGDLLVGGPFNASVNPGEMVCLLGPNGAGKSTLLRTMAGFLKPLGGDVAVGKRNIARMNPRELSREVAVVLTSRPDLQLMTVRELVATGRAPYTGFWGTLADTDEKAVVEALELVGITEFGHRQVSELSDGERQKAMIAKALAQHTRVILLDEPTAFLDYPSKVETLRLLRRLAEERQIAVFLSTHDMETALSLAHRIWLLDAELGLTVGTHEELTRGGQLERYFSRPGIAFDRTTGYFKVSR